MRIFPFKSLFAIAGLLCLVSACVPSTGRDRDFPTEEGQVSSTSQPRNLPSGERVSSSSSSDSSESTALPGLPGNGEGYGVRALTSVARMTAPVNVVENLPPAPTDLPLIDWMKIDWNGRSGALCEAGSHLRMTLTAASEPDRILCIMNELEKENILTLKLDDRTYQYEVPWLGDIHSLKLKGRTNATGLVEALTFEVVKEGEVKSALLYTNSNDKTRVRWLRRANSDLVVGQTTDAEGSSLSDGTWTIKKLTHKGIHVGVTGRYSVESHLTQQAQKLLMTGFSTSVGLRDYAASMDASIKMSGAISMPTLRLGEGAAWLKRSSRFSDFFGLLEWASGGWPIPANPQSTFVKDVSASKLITPYEITKDHLILEWERLGTPVQIISVPKAPPSVVGTCLNRYPVYELLGDNASTCRRAEY